MQKNILYDIANVSWRRISKLVGTLAIFTLIDKS